MDLQFVGMEETLIIHQRNEKATASFIFLHGSGDTGPGLAETVELLMGNPQFRHIRIIFPTAPSLPFTPFGGVMTSTWYDISNFNDSANENHFHIENSYKDIMKIIDDEVSKGIPLNRIAVAGFSRGGGMSYYMGYLYKKELAGVGVISSWLPRSSQIFDKLKQSTGEDKFPPLWQAHGASDNIIVPKLAENTVEALKNYGIKTQFKLYPRVGHELQPLILGDLFKFIQSVLPEE